jgi:hypothetical protein
MYTPAMVTTMTARNGIILTILVSSLARLAAVLVGVEAGDGCATALQFPVRAGSAASAPERLVVAASRP